MSKLDVKDIIMEIAEKGYSVITVKGTSMQPTIPRGTAVLIEPICNPRVGSVLLIKSKNELLLHRLLDRIVIKKDVWYLHKGDFSNVFGITKGSDIIGVASKYKIKKICNLKIGIFICLSKIGGLFLQIGLYSKKDLRWLIDATVPNVFGVKNLWYLCK